MRKSLTKRQPQEMPKPGNPAAILDGLDMILNKVDGISKKTKELLDLAGHIR